jgi:hypothetical protein
VKIVELNKDQPKMITLKGGVNHQSMQDINSQQTATTHLPKAHTAVGGQRQLLNAKAKPAAEELSNVANQERDATPTRKMPNTLSNMLTQSLML